MRARYACLIILLACSFIVPADLLAVVNQINGEVVPIQDDSPCPGTMNGCLQTGLNYGEGINPPSSPPTMPGPVDAILDAATGPETYLVPQTDNQFNQVNFRLLQEGAGFENLFGWYNVGSPDVRFPVIFSCRNGDRSLYEPPEENSGMLSGGYEITVDFQAEYQAGRYQGKQIGFYLISPEDSNNRNAGGDVDNCATDPYDLGTLSSGGPIDDDNADDGDNDANGFGRVYFTEQKLNNDGNYVHFLVYQSQADPMDYYFGFEDLFRGGDNDYEDTMVKVEGLVPVCQPDQEICNGEDDNCNGLVDESVTRPCATACGAGQQQCQFTNNGNPLDDWGPCSAPTPTGEQCNGLDDDCNGAIDDNVPPGGACTEGACIGQLICLAGQMICDAPAPTAEFCDGMDNDCNGLIDDNLSRACSTVCGTGVEPCAFSDDGDPTNDWGTCTAPLPTPEICNTLDDDCNGVVDDSIPPGGPCTVSGCLGELVCVAGQMECDAPAPTGEQCNGLDDDCNGAVDDNVFRPCSTACGIGQEQCQFTDDGDTVNDWINCTAPLPAPEVCDGQDNNCDGAIDNDIPPGESCGIGGCAGQMICVGGEMVCDAESPSAEICDGKDNDCDGDIDEDLLRPCQTSCGPGTEICLFTDDGDPENDWVDCTAPLPEAEVCDGVDNDCNGKVDDGVPGEDELCDHPSGNTCEQGLTKCVGGKMTCVGASAGSIEICDCEDNDCDGDIDENNPCPPGTTCIDCGCRIPCAGKEFSCPKGYACINEHCIPDTCAGISCPSGFTCVNGDCINPCAGITCSDGEVCVKGDCLPDNCYGTGCPAGQLCLEASCQPDPCAEVTCPDGEYCSAGTCLPSCGATVCGAGATCRDGACGSDPCAGVICDQGVECIDGRCDEACAGISCAPGQLCRLGGCIDDPCKTVRCYGSDEICKRGQCISSTTFIGERSNLLATGSGGLACGVTSSPMTGRRGSDLWLLFIMASLIWVGRRRARRLIPLILVGLLALISTGCQQDPYAMVAFDGGLIDSRNPETGSHCVPTSNGVELCDGLDNDCDGQIDETFNLGTDPEHCGECGRSCLLEGGLSLCELGECKVLGCAPGFVDLNQDLADGCEYECQATGVEICDEKDNDCNGQIDEIFDLTNDVDNCGACGNACQLANAIPRCQGGICLIQQCTSGFIDKDGQDTTGCETPCIKSAGGAEICDGVDNDCNGVVDDPGGVPIDLSSDPFNCGGCNVVCGLPNASVECINSSCVITGCTGAFVDADTNPVNGCECLPEGVEICDGKDQDCNGIVDDNLSNLGACGSQVGACQEGILLCQGGVAVCTGSIVPQPEVCDGVDNDCNGLVDDKLPALGVCGSGVGQCQQGTLYCENGVPVCNGGTDPQAETCDGLDNDCNGAVDDLAATLGPCGNDVGECQQGSFVCQNGIIVCSGEVVSQPEICDNLDNDCNGQIDDNVPPLGVCGLSTGPCQQGTLVCQIGSYVCTGTVDPQAETCDGLDNDCNGHIDDNVPGFPDTCGTGVGECSTGTLICDSGIPVCLGEVGPQPEMCDTKDNDCNGQLNPTQCVFAASGRENRLDQLGTSTLGAANSTQLAVGGQGERVFAVWLDRRDSRADLYGNYSTDGGMTWQSSDIGIAVDDGNNVEPQVAFGGPSASSVRVYVAYERFSGGMGQRDVYLRWSEDGGDSWSGGVQVEQIDHDAYDALYVRLAVRPGATAGDEDTVVVCWERIAITGPTNPSIRCALSTDSGQSFDEDISVSGPSTNAFVPQMAMDDNYVYVTWQEGDNIRVGRSSLVSPLSFTPRRTLNAQPGKEPVIAVDGSGGVVVVWEDLRAPLINIRANRSYNSGQTWRSDGVRVDNDVVDGDSTNPSVVMRPGGQVLVAWTDTSRGQNDIYVNHSDDGGSSWGVVARRVNDGQPGAATSLRPVIAVSPTNDNVYVAWEDYRNGVHRDIYFSVSIDDGATFSIPDYRINETTPAGAADTRSPLLWASSARVAVVWIDNRASNGGISTGPNGDIYASYVE